MAVGSSVGKRGDQSRKATKLSLSWTNVKIAVILNGPFNRIQERAGVSKAHETYDLEAIGQLY
jgi:hypothetical protein